MTGIERRLALAGVAEPATWIEKTSRFWYRRAVPGGHEFIVVDAATKQTQPAFDHARLASALSAAGGRSYERADAPLCADWLHGGPAQPGGRGRRDVVDLRPLQLRLQEE